MTVSLIGISMPNFWLGPLLAILFAVVLGWLPVAGAARPAHLVLPAVTLGTGLAAILARMTRASLLEELRELYVLAARARGALGRGASSITPSATASSRSSPSSACSSAPC
jgi:peptide/nickel transport system permease protein